MTDRKKLIKGIQECDLNGGRIGNCPYKDILLLLPERELLRKTLIRAIERAKAQSAEYGLADIIVPFKEADLILSILKEDDPDV